VSSSRDWKKIAIIYPQDTNTRQIFEIASEDAIVGGSVKLEFPKSSDFFGRVVLYDADLLGDYAEEAGSGTSAEG